MSSSPEIDSDVRHLEKLRRRLSALEQRYAALPDRTSLEAREIEHALSSARASLELAYGNLPALVAPPGDRQH